MSFHFRQDLWYYSGRAGDRLLPLNISSSAPAPFSSGTWSAGWVSSGDTYRLGLSWKDVRDKGRLRSLRMGFLDRDALCWDKDFGALSVFPSEPDGQISSGALPITSSTITFVMEALVDEEREPEAPWVLSTRTTAAGNERVAEHFAALSISQVPQDVLLYFPRCRRQIWTSEGVLRQAPYFDSLFNSGFSETEVNATPPCSKAVVNPLPFYDSDDEDADDFEEFSDASPPAVAPHKTVTITETSYWTYLAVVCWLQSGQITFAPLTSSFLWPEYSLAAAAQARKDTILRTSFDSDHSPMRVLPVSPKSVFRLADFLDLSALATLALADFSSRLTVFNVVHELFSEGSAYCHQIREKALEFVVKNLGEVVKSEEWRGVKARAEAGELQEWEGRVWTKLAIRLAEQ
ncbi:hypothetical protein JCM6882_003328 [Rhodosporidiobolus microsporus]